MNCCCFVGRCCEVVLLVVLRLLCVSLLIWRVLGIVYFTRFCVRANWIAVCVVYWLSVCCLVLSAFVMLIVALCVLE